MERKPDIEAAVNYIYHHAAEEALHNDELSPARRNHVIAMLKGGLKLGIFSVKGAAHMIKTISKMWSASDAADE